MGLFSTNKTITVSSAIYNLAGDINERPDFLKTVTQGHIIIDRGRTFSEDLSESYLNGPGMKLRSFARWARLSGYSSSLGLPAGQLNLAVDVDIATLVSQIPVDAGGTIQVTTAVIGTADYSSWVDQWMLDNFPSEIDTDFTADFNEDTFLVTITRAGGSIHTFAPLGFVRGAKYLYASYFQTMGGEDGPVTTGTPIYLGSGSFPSTSGWTNLSSTTIPQTMTLYTDSTEVSSYSDGRPVETVPSSSGVLTAYNDLESVWEKVTFTGMGGGGIGGSTTALKQTQYRHTIGTKLTTTTSSTVVTTIAGGVTKTSVTTTLTDTIVYEKDYRIDEQTNTIKSWGPGKLLIYRQGSGNSTLDSLFQTTTGQGSFFPFIPLRINNTFVEPGGDWDGTYASNKRAIKRSIGASYDDLLDKVKDNPSIGDIDYAYVTFGVSLNTKENTGRRYIYEFFQEIMIGQDLTGSGYDAWRTNYDVLRPQVDAWVAWKAAQTTTGDPLFGTDEPTLPTFVEPPSGSVRHASEGAEYINYDMTVTWSSIKEIVGSGPKWEGARKGDFKFEMGTGTSTYESWFIGGDMDLNFNEGDLSAILLHWQEDDDTWRTLEIRGLNHTNMIYGGKGVYISASEALADEEESGFLIPLHEGIFRRLPLIASTQLSTSCCYMVFNCYQVVKEKWYQTSWFKILLVIIVIVITVVSGGAGAGSVGLLGANGAVGASLGFSGVTAAIVGAVANAVAAMLVVQIITRVSTAIFGDKVGAIVGAIASVIAIQVGIGIMNGGIGSLSTAISDLSRADNLLKLTMAAGKGYSEFTRIGTQETLAAGQVELNAINTKTTELAAEFEKEFGPGHDIITQQALTASTASGLGESLDSFLGRTLMTGDDIAGLSLDMVSRFAELTLQTELPT